jgi:hypothetical protein
VCRYTGLTRFEKEVIKKRAIEVMNAVEKDMERGERIYVFKVFGTNTLFVKYYHRDYEYLRGWCSDPTQPFLFAILKFLKNRRGSRRHLYLYGYLAIVSRADPKLMLKRLAETPDKVIELPATPEMYEIVDKQLGKPRLLRRGGALVRYAFKPLAVVYCGVGVSICG